MHRQFIKYLLVGALVVAVNLSVLYALTEFVHIFYLLSAVCAFAVSFVVSFILQKYWTFRDSSRKSVHRQAALYLFVQLVNLSLNTGLLYVFVTYLHVWYILSQALISLLLAIGIFAINKLFIFNRTSP